jgi:hypothetical protein
MLKAKTEIGQIGPEVAAVIGDLIHLGIAIVEPADESGARPVVKVEADEAAVLLEAPPLLPVLRAVLDDNPLVIGVTPCRGDTALVQASAESRIPSAAECLVVVTPSAERDIGIEIVRDSHKLPEFTPSGVSRWASSQIHAGIEIAAEQQGLIARYDLPAGATAIIGPGTIYRLRCGDGAEGVKMACIPCRATPMRLATDGNRTEIVRQSGVRLWV